MKRFSDRERVFAAPGDRRASSGGRIRGRRDAAAWLLCGLTGWCAGLTNGLLGAAGGILLVTVLPYLPLPASLLLTKESGAAGGILRPSTARPDRRDGFALALTVMLPVSALSFWRYASAGLLPEGYTLWTLILPAALGGLLGATLLDRLSPQRLRLIFSVLILVSGLRMVA